MTTITLTGVVVGYSASILPDPVVGLSPPQAGPISTLSADYEAPPHQNATLTFRISGKSEISLWPEFSQPNGNINIANRAGPRIDTFAVDILPNASILQFNEDDDTFAIGGGGIWLFEVGGYNVMGIRFAEQGFSAGSNFFVLLNSPDVLRSGNDAFFALFNENATWGPYGATRSYDAGDAPFTVPFSSFVGAPVTVDETIFGTDDDDEILGGIGHDKIIALPGDDTIKGQRGEDTIFGGNGNDVLSGGQDIDAINGGRGQDLINGDDGFDILSGGGGADLIYGGRNSDLISGDAGNDAIYAGRGNDTAAGGAGDDNVIGGRGNDMVTGGIGFDTLRGGDGSDDLRGGKNADLLDGGDGADFLLGGKGHDTLIGGNDTDAQSVQGDFMDGGEGNDLIQAGGDGALMTGSAGFDTMVGGAGADAFAFNTGHDVDTVRDFNPTQDRLLISMDAESYASSGAPASMVQFFQNFVSSTGGDVQIIFDGGIDALNIENITEFELNGAITLTLDDGTILV